MVDIIKDTLIDSLKLLPFLFVAFLLLEYVEHKISNKNKMIIEKSGKFGPLIGGLLGAFPQCGFSATMTNLYAMRVITIGTLISIYLSTSDEMLPILLTQGFKLQTILQILGLKVLIGMVSGFIIDYILRNKRKVKEHIHDFCDEEHCDCNHGIFLSSLKHTLNIIIFITLISFLLNLLIYYLGEDNISKIFMKDNILGPFVASLVGLIPNCAASVVLTELYVENAITFGSTMAGLLTGSGVALLLLFKVNKDMKENFKIILTIYIIGVLSGIIIDLIGLNIH